MCIRDSHGPLPPAMQQYFKVGEVDFFACGLSLVLHPKNPMVPTVHANWRYFEMYDKQGNTIDQWFGGGQDPVSYTHLRAHETKANLVCRLLLEKKKNKIEKKEQEIQKSKKNKEKEKKKNTKN